MSRSRAATQRQPPLKDHVPTTRAFSEIARICRQGGLNWRFRTILTATPTLCAPLLPSGLADSDPSKPRAVGAMDIHPSFGAARMRLRAAPLFALDFAHRSRLRRRRAQKSKAPRWPARPARHLRAGKWAGDRSRPPCPHAAKGISSAAGSRSCSAGASTALAESSYRTRAAAVTLPTPPRAV